MVSFANPGQIAEAAELCQSFTLDNGAWTFRQRGIDLDVEKLAEWVGLWCRHPSCDWYCIPDVIDGGHEENAKMRARWSAAVDSRTWGLGIPVWHMDEPLEVLRDFMQWTSPAIAIGSAGEYSQVGSGRWWGRMAEAMEVACDEEGRPLKRLHGLRMLDPTVFSHLPLSSADSTNVARNCGIDKSWSGPYTPKSVRMRAMVMMERIECHASASRWNFESVGIQKNMELFG